MASQGVRARVFRGAVDAGGVLAAWLLFLALENVVVGVGCRSLFAGSWEMAAARYQVTPIALAALLPLSFGAVAIARGAGRGRGVEVLLGALAAGAAYGVSFGRHMASWALRAPFIAAATAIALAIAWWVVPRAARAAGRDVALLGAAVAAAAWSADVLVLPRLYPAFHAALLVIALAAAALVSLAWRGAALARHVGVAMIALAIVCTAYTPAAARRVRLSDNLRFVLTEHAPALGRAVALAALVAPPPPLDDAASAPDVPTLNAARALDWSGRDVLLISVDALRADHVSAYGYARATTPHIDALAREGALFEAAYCPTPHTSYSVTSMMTGKYMRPLLALGLGEDSDTWATDVRSYGYRTAAFYPPAVFFIDEDRFRGFRDRRLGFEYTKVEFAEPALREAQIVEYLASVPADQPLFLWVHLFEPHEPYVRHAEHPFGPSEGFTDMDAYDSEIAAADQGVGAIVLRVRAARPHIAVVVTADHGEEFSEHGGRYHGTTVYEEQVRVPLVVVGPGVAAGRIAVPVQTIDLLPTVLSALDIPRPPRVRGRDLGPLLARGAASDDAGLAFAETEDYSLLARGADRLVCLRRSRACALYDAKRDPAEQHDLAREQEHKVLDMKRAVAAIEREHGRFEAGGAANLPEALRRGMQGDAEAAEDVASLLDDADLQVRRKAAEVTYDLHVARVRPQVERARAKDEDEEVRRWCALALLRIGAAPTRDAALLAADPEAMWRRRAALALAEQGDGRGEGDLVAWFDDPAGRDFARTRELLLALGKIHATRAVPSLVRALADVRLRPYVADALGVIGAPAAREPLLGSLAIERYVTARQHEARALLALGARGELRAPLERFAGLPEPMADAIGLAREAGLLTPERGGWSSPSASPSVDVALTPTRPTRALRLIVLAATPDGTTTGTANGRDLAFLRAPRGGGQAADPEAGSAPEGAVRIAELKDVHSASIALHLEDRAGLLGAWIVPLSTEIEPPQARDAGSADAELR